MNDWYANGGRDYFCPSCRTGFDRKEGGSHVCPECGVDGRSRQQKKRDELVAKGAGLAQLQPRSPADVYIIKGNPSVDTDNAAKYDAFYNAVKQHVESHGLSADFDPGEEYTTPPGGKFWIGHSRGGSRLRFGPERGVRTLRLDDYEPEETRKRQAAAFAELFKKLRVNTVAEVPLKMRPLPGPEHYTFNDDMKRAISEMLAPKVEPGLTQPLGAKQAGLADHVLVSGHSGAGKSTVAAQIGEALGRPVVSVDDHPDVKPFFRDDPDNRHLLKGTPERAAFRDLKRRAALETLRGLSEPSVVEGTQLASLPRRELSQYPARVHVTTPLQQLLRQRFDRVLRKAEAKGSPIDPDSEEGRRRFQVGRDLYRDNRPAVGRYGGTAGTERFDTTSGDFAALLESLRRKQTKQADVAETPATVDLFRGLRNQYDDPEESRDEYEKLVGRAVAGQLAPGEARKFQSLGRRREQFYTPDEASARSYAGPDGQLVTLQVPSEDLPRLRWTYNNLGKPTQTMTGAADSSLLRQLLAESRWKQRVVAAKQADLKEDKALTALQILHRGGGRGNVRTIRLRPSYLLGGEEV